MSLASCPEPSIVVDRGLALHKVLRLLVLGGGWDGGSRSSGFLQALILVVPFQLLQVQAI